jgi:hypothetical protein
VLDQLYTQFCDTADSAERSAAEVSDKPTLTVAYYILSEHEHACTVMVSCKSGAAHLLASLQLNTLSWFTGATAAVCCTC